MNGSLGGVLSFAGLLDKWKDPETDEQVVSCTIIVTDANALMRPIHDRMPMLLDKASYRLPICAEGNET
jgi:putative SOS response-associated peptidase YedK